MKLASRLAVSAIALALVPLAGAGPASAGETGDTATYEIWFDQFCDGLTLNLPSAGLGTKGTIDGHHNGCDEGGVLGTAIPKGKKYGVDLGTEFVSLPKYGIFTDVRADHTFTMYLLSGGVLFPGLTSTWTDGPPPLDARGAKSSVTQALSVARAKAAKAANASKAATAASPAGTKTFTLVDECYEVTLTQPSAGTGVKGTVDGSLSGCKTDGVIGAYGKITGKKKTYGVQYFDPAVSTYVHTLIFKNKTWVTYSLDGEQMVILDQGTWE